MNNKEQRLTLLDTAELQSGKLRPIVNAAWKQRHNARRFIFDREASARVGEMLRENMDLLIDNIEFARPPYPTTFFELDSRAMWHGWHPEVPSNTTADEKVGFLIHNGSVIVLASGPVFKTTEDGRGLTAVYTKKAAVCGMSFRINRPQSLPFAKLTGLPTELADLCKVSYVFGGQREQDAHYFVDRLTERTKVNLPAIGDAWTHAQIAAHFDVTPSYINNKPSEVIKLSFLGGGDPMLLTTMLLLLNQPSRYVDLEHVGREVGLWRGARMVFHEHHVVHLKLGRSAKVRDIFNLTDRRAPIAHEVMGHWKHYNKSLGCSHHHPDQRQAWEPVGPERTISGDYKRYWCSLCLQRRTWTEDFTTGGPGVATKHYEVTR